MQSVFHYRQVTDTTCEYENLIAVGLALSMSRRAIDRPPKSTRRAEPDASKVVVKSQTASER